MYKTQYIVLKVQLFLCAETTESIKGLVMIMKNNVVHKESFMSSC